MTSGGQVLYLWFRGGGHEVPANGCAHGRFNVSNASYHSATHDYLDMSGTARRACYSEHSRNLMNFEKIVALIPFSPFPKLRERCRRRGVFNRTPCLQGKGTSETWPPSPCRRGAGGEVQSLYFFQSSLIVGFSMVKTSNRLLCIQIIMCGEVLRIVHEAYGWSRILLTLGQPVSGFV